MTGDYWTKLTSNRLSRRRALVTTGAGALGAAFLAACGGSDDSGGGSKDSGAAKKKDNSGLLASPTSDSSARKRGGTLNYVPRPALSSATLEQSLGGNGSGSILVHLAYSQMMRAKISTYDKVPESVWEPEFASSYEQSPDGLTVTFKLRGLKFDDRAPTNGRKSTSEDVKYSWDRFVKTNLRAPELANAKSPDGPVLDVQTPDANTAVFKLAFPMAPFFAYLGSSFFPFIYPKEADGGYDTRSIARGTGQWVIPDNRPTGNAELTRNPNYDHGNGEPFFDKLNLLNINENSTIYAQVNAGQIEFDNGLVQEDILKLKKSNNKMVMYQRPFFAKGCGAWFFGRKAGSPWNDERVRRALALQMDADLWGDTFSNRQKLEAEGLPVNTAWFATAGPGYNWWLDPSPNNNKLGEQAKALHKNPAEAKKLLSAAGQKTPLEQTYHFVPNPARDPLYQGMLGIFADSGDFKFKMQDWPDMNQYYLNVRNTGGNFDGVSNAFYFDHHDFDWTMYLSYHPSSTDFWIGKQNEDKKMTELVVKQRRELDQKKREAIFQEFVKYNVEKMYYIPYHFPVDWQPYYVAQPWVGGFGWHQPYIEQYPGGAGQILSQYWFDASKKS